MKHLLHTAPSLWRRRQVIKLLAAGSVAALLPRTAFAGQSVAMLRRAIPSSGETMPVIGLGTARVFDVGASSAEREPMAEVLRTLVNNGGALVDTSPMYGQAEKVTGDLAAGAKIREKLFLATKVWAEGREVGIAQMNRSFKLLRTDRIDLMQVHNLIDTDTHLKTIAEWKRTGRVRYLGITHYRIDAHRALADVIKRHKIDFVQLNYSIATRDAEDYLLPFAAEKGIAVLVNRPFEQGELFKLTRGRNLPEWAGDIDCGTWAQFFLKYIVSHPAVTCVIPATSKAEHMIDNSRAGFGRLPDARQRKRMAALIDGI